MEMADVITWGIWAKRNVNGKQTGNKYASLFFRAASYSAIRLFLSSVTREVLLFTKISLFLMQGWKYEALTEDRNY